MCVLINVPVVWATLYATYLNYCPSLAALAQPESHSQQSKSDDIGRKPRPRQRAFFVPRQTYCTSYWWSVVGLPLPIYWRRSQIHPEALVNLMNTLRLSFNIIGEIWSAKISSQCSDRHIDIHTQHLMTSATIKPQPHSEFTFSEGSVSGLLLEWRAVSSPKRGGSMRSSYICLRASLLRPPKRLSAP